MFNKTVTLDIGETWVKVMVVKGKKVKKWASTPLPPGAIKDGLILDPEAVGSAVSRLLEAERIKRGKAIVSLSGFHSLLRLVTLPELPEKFIAEAVHQEAERVMPVPLDQLYLSWQTTSISGGERQVILLGLPRNTVDAEVQTLRQLGINPYLMDLKPLALARAINRREAIIIDVQPRSVDIVIVVKGIPHVMRTIFLPGETSSEETATYLADELDKTLSLYHSSYPEQPLGVDTPVFITGEVADDSSIIEPVVDKVGYRVESLSLPVKCPSDLPLAQYVVNIGLALKQVALPARSGEGSSPWLAKLNLLPEVYQQRRRPIGQMLVLPTTIIAGIAILFPLFSLVEEVTNECTELRLELSIANQALQQRRLEQKALAELEEKLVGMEKKIEEVKAPSHSMRTMVSTLSTNRQTVYRNLYLAITATLLSTVELSSVEHTGNTLTVVGTADTQDTVLSYGRALRNTGMFSNVLISSMHDTDDGVDFTLVLVEIGTGERVSGDGGNAD